MRKVLILPVLAAALAAAAPAMADDDYRGGPGVPRDQWLSASDAIQKLAAQGYKVTEIEADDGTYEFEATNSSGARVEGHAHPATGDVISTRPDVDD
jgi:hypothetical protein